MTRVQFGVVCGLLVGILVGVMMPILEPARSGHVFEYKIISFKDQDLEKQMNVAGDNGWEMVFARRATSGGSEHEVAYEMIFRRVK